MYNEIMQSLNFFLSCSIRNLTLAFLSVLFTIKIDVSPFLQVLIPTVVFFHESNYYTIYTIAHYEGLQSRRSSDKFWAQERRLFRQKDVIFPSFSSVSMNFFSLI